MIFFDKFFKKKISIADVLSSLQHFSNDVKSLNDFVSVASSYFGSNWKFNLELYINSLPQIERDKYFPLFDNLLNFETALRLWTSAQQVLKGAKPLNADIINDLPEYEKFLPKFGIEGVRLLEKFKAQFDISIPKNNNQVSERIEQISSVDDVQDLKENQSILKQSSDEISSDQALDEISPAPSAPFNNQHILKKVSSDELEQGVFSKIKNQADTELNISSSNLNDVKVSNEDLEKNVPEDDLEKDFPDDDWDLKNFLKIHIFLSKSREIMSAICLFKNVSSLENYPYYGFILDVIDYIIVQGEKILSSKSEDLINVYFKNGKKELSDLIDFYKKQKEDEMLIPISQLNTESEKKEYEVVE